MRLARWVCLASSISRALLRAGRLRYEPKLSPHAEAELWLGELVESTSRGYIVLYPEVAAALRAQLASPDAESDDLLLAKALLNRPERTQVPQLVELEERLIWSGLTRGASDESVDAALRPVLKAMLEGSDRKGLKRWVAGLRRRVPEIAASELALLVEGVAKTALNGTAGTIPGGLLERLPPDHKAILARVVPGTAQIGIRVGGSRLTINEPPQDTDDVIEIPLTEPKALFLQAVGPGAQQPSVITLASPGTLSSSEPVPTIVDAQLPFTLTSVGGDEYRVESLRSTVESIEASIGESLVEIGDLSGALFGFGILIAPRTIVSTTAVLQHGTRYQVRFPQLSQIWQTATGQVRDPESKVIFDAPALLRLESDPPPGAGPARRSSRSIWDGPVLVRRAEAQADEPSWTSYYASDQDRLGSVRLRSSRKPDRVRLLGHTGSPVVDPSDGALFGLCISSPHLASCVLWDEIDEMVYGTPAAAADPIPADAGTAADEPIDVYLSYAHRDNEPLLNGPGWVDILRDILEKRFYAYAGRRARIWFVSNIVGGDIFEQTIAAAISRSAIFVAVISPAYVESQWCLRELSSFIERAERSGGMTVGSRSRLVKVTKLPVSPEQLPRALADSVGYTLFDGGVDRAPVEIDPTLGEEARSRFIKAADNLVHDLLATLQEIERKDTTPKPSSGVAVYLAETSFDMRDEAKRLRHTLEQYGHTVLPAAPLSFDSLGYADSVRATLQDCALSVHLVGERYGMIPEGAAESVVALQHRSAGDEAKRRAGFRRLTWLRPGAQPTDPRQQEFVRSLYDDPNLVVTSMEDFSSYLRRMTSSPTLASPAAPPGTAPLVQEIYVMFDPLDVEAARPITAWLNDRGFTVTWPATDGGPEQRRRHKANIARCDAVAIVYGRSSEAWLRAQLRDLRSAARALPTGIVLAAPDSPEKRAFRPPGVMRISALEGFDPAAMEWFARRLAETQPDRPTISVYLIYDAIDEHAAQPVAAQLFELGIDVMLPLFEGEERDLRADHEASLKSCDAVMIVYGRSSELWLRTKLRDLRRAFGYGRTRPFSARAILLIDPVTPEKAYFRSEEVSALTAFGDDLDRQVIEQFVNAVRSPDSGAQ